MRNLLLDFKKFDQSILRLMKSGIRFSFMICLFSTLLLVVYMSVHIPNLFYIGISLFQTSLFFIAAFITCGFVFNRAIH